jgi:hypothetical protein
MLQDINCPKCKYLFPVTQARHPVGVDCPKCDTGLTVEFRKRPAPVDPGEPPYEVLVEPGKPLNTAATSAASAKKLRHEEDEEETEAPGMGGSSFLVVFSALFASLLSIAALGATGYFLFTNLDTSDAALNNINTTPAPNANPGNKFPVLKGPGPAPVGPFGPPGTTPQPKSFDLKPLTGPVPPIQEVSLPAELSTIALPSKVGAVAVGGGGRYVVMHFPERGLLGVLDANTGKIQATPADTGDVKLAAGLTRLVMLVPNAKIMRIYTLPDLKKLYDASSPVEGLGSIAMGARTNGPMIGVGTFGGIHVMDVKDDGVQENENGRMDKLEMHWGGANLRATPDGMAYLTCEGYDRGKKTKLAFVEGKQWKRREFSIPLPFAGADGNLYGNGLVANLQGVDLRAGGVGAGSGAWYIPAVCGASGAFLKVVQAQGRGADNQKAVTMTIHRKGNANAPAAGTPQLTGLPEFAGLFDPWGNPASDHPLDCHFFLFPEAKLLAIISANKDKLILRKVEMPTP